FATDLVPQTILAGDFVEFSIEFTPIVYGAVTDVMYILSDDPNYSVFEVNLSGFGYVDEAGAGYALALNGASEYVSLNRTEMVSVLTFEAWINTTSTAVNNGYAGNPALTVIGDYDGAVRGAFGVHAGVVRYTHWSGSGLVYDLIDGSTVVSDGQWHHIAVVH